MSTAVRQARRGRHLDQAGRRATAPGVERDNLALALGWFSIGLGVAQVVTPRAVERLVGVRDTPRRRLVMRLVGVREIAAGAGIVTQPQPAGWLWARVAGDVKDLALLGRALRAPDARRGRTAAAAASVAGILGADVAEAVRSSRGGPTPGETGIRVAQATTVRKPRDEVYGFWRDFESFPRFMAHVESVRRTGERTSHWTVKGPLGMTVEWDAETLEDLPGERISWRTLPGAQVEHEGTVRFLDAPGDRGTEVHVELCYAPPGGGVGATLAKLLGEEPEAQAYDDLRRSKQLLETGEIVRSEGSPAGPSLVQQLFQRAAQPFDRERDRERQPQAVAP